MPKYSYWAAAFGHLASYVVMFVISSVLGAKYYPIPYRWSRLAGIFVLMGAVYGLCMLLDNIFFADVALGSSPAGMVALKLGVHTVFILAYMAFSWVLIRSKSRN